jgi:enoyl-CoA hydratase
VSGTVIFLGDDLEASLAGHIVTITLARPPVNAFRTQTWCELGEALAECAGLRAPKVLVLRSGLDGIFSAGADVKELPMTPADDERRQWITRTVLSAVAEHPVPVVAAVGGLALGGACALVSQADIRLGSRRARFAMPEIDVGRCGGSRHLRQHLDSGTVRWMAFTGKQLDAEQAASRGLLTWVVDDLDGETQELAACIAGKSPTALRMTKQSIGLSESLEVAAGYAVEQQFSLRLAQTPDAAEAAAAFAGKRPPRWQLPDQGGAQQ